MKAKRVKESLNEIRVVDKGAYIDEEYMEEVLTAIIHGNMGFFGGIGEEGQVRDAFEERILDDPELSKIFSDGLKRHVPARMMGARLYKIMNKKGLANYGDVLESLSEELRDWPEDEDHTDRNSEYIPGNSHKVVPQTAPYRSPEKFKGLDRNMWLAKLQEDLKQNKYNLKKAGLYSGPIAEQIDILLNILKEDFDMK